MNTSTEDGMLQWYFEYIERNDQGNQIGPCMQYSMVHDALLEMRYIRVGEYVAKTDRVIDLPKNWFMGNGTNEDYRIPRRVHA